MRLGVRIAFLVAGACRCRPPANGAQPQVDVHGYHLLSCCNLGGDRQDRHNAVTLALTQFLQSAGLTARREDRSLLRLLQPLNNKERMDIHIPNFDSPGCSLNLDVTIADCRAHHFSNASHPAAPGAAALAAERQKIRRYRPKYDRIHHEFQPFAIEAFGRWGPSARSVFRRILSKVMHNSRSSFPRSVSARFWKARITMALFVQSMSGLQSRMISVLQHRRVLPPRPL